MVSKEAASFWFSRFLYCNTGWDFLHSKILTSRGKQLLQEGNYTREAKEASRIILFNLSLFVIKESGEHKKQEISKRVMKPVKYRHF